VTPPELNDLRVVHAIPAHIWRSAPDGAVQFVNQQWMDYTGLSQENSQGWGWVSVIHHDDRPGLLDCVAARPRGGTTRGAEARFRRFDGASRWYLIRMVPIRDESGALLGWYGANTDINDLKQAQMKLRQDEKELRQMTDATQLPIIVFSAEGRLLYADRFSLTDGGLSLEDFQRDGWRERSTTPMTGRPSGPDRFHRAHHGRHGYRQGARRPRDSQAFSALGPPVCGRELRGGSGLAHRLWIDSVASEAHLRGPCNVDKEIRAC